MGVRMMMGMRVVMFDRNHNHLTVAYAAFGDDFIGKVAHILRLAFQQRDFQATAVIKMHMQAGEGKIVMIVESARQPAR